MKEKVFALLTTLTDDPKYPTPLTFDQICEKLSARPAEKFQIANAIIALGKEGKIVLIGDLYGVIVE